MKIRFTLEELRAKLSVTTQYIGKGLGREVFDSRSKYNVWKLPYARSFHDGDEENFREYNSFISGLYQYEGRNYLARCRLINTSDNRNVLVMEKVEYAEYQNNMPFWVNFVDCQQVGFNFKGQLVAYDYGNF